MAEVVDLMDAPATGELETVSAQIEQEKAAATESAQKPQRELPEKLRGKSADEIADMYLNAEKKASRLANEVHEVRTLADQLIRQQATKPAQQIQPEQKAPDFFDDPQKAIQYAVENNPKVRAVEQMAEHQRKVLAQQQFAALHPDAQQITADPDFRAWVAGSKIRSELFARGNAYDVESAAELLGTWKTVRALHSRQQQEHAKQVDATEAKARADAMRSAAVDTGGSGETTKKVYRRADLIRMRMQRPDQYEAMQDDIMRAYQEGRVR